MSNPNWSASIRKEIRNNRPERDSVGFPAHVREKVARLALERRKAGDEWGQIARAMGISESSLERWTKAYGKEPSAESDLEKWGAVAKVVRSSIEPAPASYAVSNGFGLREFASEQEALDYFGARCIEGKKPALWKRLDAEPVTTARIVQR